MGAEDARTRYPADPALLQGRLGLVPWEAGTHLALRTGRRLVVPLFLLSGALLIVTGRTNEDGSVEVGPGATPEEGYGAALVDPALTPAVIATVLGLAVLAGGLALSWVISRRLEPGPGGRGRLKRALTGGLAYGDRWALTKAVNGLRLLRETDADARRSLDRWRPDLGSRVSRSGRGAQILCWAAVVAMVVLAWIEGLDTSFEWHL